MSGMASPAPGSRGSFSGEERRPCLDSSLCIVCLAIRATPQTLWSSAGTASPTTDACPTRHTHPYRHQQGGCGCSYTRVTEAWNHEALPGDHFMSESPPRSAAIGGKPWVVAQRISETRPGEQVIGQPYRTFRAATKRIRRKSKYSMDPPKSGGTGASDTGDTGAQSLTAETLTGGKTGTPTSPAAYHQARAGAVVVGDFGAKRLSSPSMESTVRRAAWNRRGSRGLATPLPEIMSDSALQVQVQYMR